MINRGDQVPIVKPILGGGHVACEVITDDPSDQVNWTIYIALSLRGCTHFVYFPCVQAKQLNRLVFVNLIPEVGL